MCLVLVCAFQIYAGQRRTLNCMTTTTTYFKTHLRAIRRLRINHAGAPLLLYIGGKNDVTIHMKHYSIVQRAVHCSPIAIVIFLTAAFALCDRLFAVHVGDLEQVLEEKLCDATKRTCSGDVASSASLSSRILM